MRTIPIGTRGVFEAHVERQDLASVFKDPSLPPILATPVMIKFMENAALRAVAPYLEGNEVTLGIFVSVRHVAATPVGRFVTAAAEVTEVVGSRVVFSIRATDGDEEIGTGTHERRVVDFERFTRRLANSRDASNPEPSR